MVHKSVNKKTHLEVMECHLPYEIRQCHLPDTSKRDPL